jgi:iron complex transport system substrate-binding protein
MSRVIFALLLALLCAQPALAQYVDGTGTKIPYGLNAQRIVSLAPNTTEILYYIGFGGKVVGRTDYCNFPKEVEKLPSVGGMVDTSLEKIVALKPDLVIAYQGNNLELISQLRQLKINVVALREASQVRHIGTQMQELYNICKGPGGPERPDSIRLWQKRLAGLRRTPAAPPTLFYGMPGEIVYTAAPGSFIGNAIEMAGARNVVPAGKQRWPQVGAEFIVASKPAWLLVTTPCEGHTELADASKSIQQNLKADPVWSKLPAVAKDRIVVIDADVLLRPGPRILDAVDQLATAIHGPKK